MWRISPGFRRIPTINALTDEEHPCQILADVFTFQEKRGSIAGKVVTFVGDGACNVANSWIFAAAKFGFELRIAAPESFPARPGVAGARGREGHLHRRLAGRRPRVPTCYTRTCGFRWAKKPNPPSGLAQLQGYQVNGALLKLANPGALVMHCLPAYRGKEIDEETFEANAQTIFDQAENRLHAQKAVLDWLVS